MPHREVPDVLDHKIFKSYASHLDDPKDKAKMDDMFDNLSRVHGW